MNKFTKEEISLCKQVAEKHRTSIKKGAWIIQEERADIPLLVIETISRSVILNVGYETKFEARYEDCVLLWTISDCLEFLREKYDHVDLETRRDIHNCSVGQSGEHNGHGWTLIDWQEEGNGKTALEACLKAMLAVLKEAK